MFCQICMYLLYVPLIDYMFDPYDQLFSIILNVLNTLLNSLNLVNASLHELQPLLNSLSITKFNKLVTTLRECIVLLNIVLHKLFRYALINVKVI